MSTSPMPTLYYFHAVRNAYNGRRRLYTLLEYEHTVLSPRHYITTDVICHEKDDHKPGDIRTAHRRMVEGRHNKRPPDRYEGEIRRRRASTTLFHGRRGAAPPACPHPPGGGVRPTLACSGGGSVNGWWGRMQVEASNIAPRWEGNVRVFIASHQGSGHSGSVW